MAKIISVIATLVLIAAAVALVLRQGVIATGPISAALQIASLLLVLWARLTFGFRSFHFAANPTPGSLITTGPYRFIRNPIYTAVLLACWAGVAVHWSATNAELALVVTVTTAIRIACEEKLLRAVYPEYGDYAKRTARVIPFVV